MDFQLPALYGGETYRKVAHLGRGSFGDAWLIERVPSWRSFRYRNSTNLPDKLVCKEIFYGNSDTSQEVLKSIKQECDLLKISAHPNIVSYFSYNGIESIQMARLYMEYCEGGDLAKFIRDVDAKRKSLTEDTVWKIIFQLASALAYLHHGLAIDEENNKFYVKSRWKAILHRDIKPSNVLLLSGKYTSDGGIKVKLCDFGLGKLHTPDLSGTYVGTRGYKAPEITRDDAKWSLKADIYSLGRTIEKLSKSLGSQSINDIVNKCISEIPEDRPSTLTLVEIAGYKIHRMKRSEIVPTGLRSHFTTYIRQNSRDIPFPVDIAEQLDSAGNSPFMMITRDEVLPRIGSMRQFDSAKSSPFMEIARCDSLTETNSMRKFDSARSSPDLVFPGYEVLPMIGSMRQFDSAKSSPFMEIAGYDNLTETSPMPQFDSAKSSPYMVIPRDEILPRMGSMRQFDSTKGSPFGKDEVIPMIDVIRQYRKEVYDDSDQYHVYSNNYYNINGWKQCRFLTFVGIGGIEVLQRNGQDEPVERLKLLLEDVGYYNKITMDRPTKKGSGDIPLIEQRLLKLGADANLVFACLLNGGGF